MSTTFNNPAELPEGSEGGGTGPIRWRPGPGPSEYPIELGASHQALINEIFTLTLRVQALETQLLSHRLGSALGHLGSHIPRPGGGGGPHEYPQFSGFERAARRGGPGPQELEMEGGEGTGRGGGGTIFGGRPPHEIQEFQASHLTEVLQAIARIVERLNVLEGKVLSAIENVSR